MSIYSTLLMLTSTHPGWRFSCAPAPALRELLVALGWNTDVLGGLVAPDDSSSGKIAQKALSKIFYNTLSVGCRSVS